MSAPAECIDKNNGNMARSSLFRSTSPRTPSRPTAASDQEPTPPTSDPNDSKTAFATDDDGDTVAPPHPFLAYARRVRSFASPLKLNKTRYLLTFVDEQVAQQWWGLMQQEYPDSVRESSQLFSFRSDRVPVKAWENPRFAHLKDKWTYRQLEGSIPVLSAQDTHHGDDAKQIPRRALGRMLSTPTLHTSGESHGPPPLIHARSDSIIEDPFTGADTSNRNHIDLAELNRTLDRMHMMMNQTNLRIDALAEKQQLYTDSLDKLQAAMQENARQIRSLTTQQQAGAINNKNMRTTIERNSSHITTVLERQVNEVASSERMEGRIQHTAERLDEVAKNQRTNADDTRQTKSIVTRTAEQIQTVLDHQRETDEKLNSMHAVLEKVSITTLRSSSTTSASTLQKLQTTIDQQSVHLASLTSGHKATHKATQKAQTSIEQIVSEQANVSTRLDRIQAATELNASLSKKGMDKLQSIAEQNANLAKQATDKQTARLEDQLATSLGTHAAKAHAASTQHQNHVTKLCNRTLDKVETEASRRNERIVRCDHDVMPPPRKMNRKLVGYVYSRVGD